MLHHPNYKWTQLLVLNDWCKYGIKIWYSFRCSFAQGLVFNPWYFGKTLLLVLDRRCKVLVTLCLNQHFFRWIMMNTFDVLETVLRNHQIFFRNNLILSYIEKPVSRRENPVSWMGKLVFGMGKSVCWIEKLI